MRDQVFISYSHRDRELMDELLVHLKPSLRSGAVTAWSDLQIPSGGDWMQEIQTALSATSAAVLLVSPDFLASDFIYEHELGPLLKEAAAGGVKILWILLRACTYEVTPLKNYQAVVSPPDKPLAEMKEDRDQAWVRLCREIKNAVSPLLLPPASEGPPPPAPVQASGGLPKQEDVRIAVNSFSIYFQEASRQISLLTSYKDLHDFLHQVPDRFVAPIALEVKRYPDDESALANLSHHADDLRDAVESLDQLVSQGTFDGDEPEKARRELAAAQTTLEAALAATSGDGLRDALWHLNRIPRLMPRIDLRLNNAAKALNLRALVATMETVCSTLRSLGLRSQQLELFEDGARVLARLNLSLDATVDDHYRWQSVEEELRRIDGDLARSLDELECSWPQLKAQIEPLCIGRAEEWAVELTSYGERLDLTLKARDPVKVRELFQRYRRRAGQRFFRVDVDLRRQCHELRDAGRPLDIVGRFIG